MSGAVLGWQLLIFVSFLLGFRLWRGLAAFWMIWTLVQVAALPLSVLQFITIGLGVYVARSIGGGVAPQIPERREAPVMPEVSRGLSGDTKGILIMTFGVPGCLAIGHVIKEAQGNEDLAAPVMLIGIVVVLCASTYYMFFRK